MSSNNVLGRIKKSKEESTEDVGVRTRTRTRSPVSSSRAQEKTQNQEPISAVRRGSKGYENFKKERELAAKKAEKRREQLAATGGYVSRFYLPNKGSEEDRRADIIILDASFNQAAFIKEHDIWNPNATDFKDKMKHELCYADIGVECPICKVEQKPASNILMLTIIDCREYTNQKTGKVVPFTKKLLPVKDDTTISILNEYDGKFGGLRGLKLTMLRGTDKMSAKTGSPQFPEIIKEEDLVEALTIDPVLSDDGKVIRDAEFYLRAYDYDKIFQYEPLADKQAEYGVAPTAGSPQDIDATWGDSESTTRQLDDSDDSPDGDSTGAEDIPFDED